MCCRLLIGLLAFLLACAACNGNKPGHVLELSEGQLGAYRDFYARVDDSLTANPRWVRQQVEKRLAAEPDSLLWYYYAGILLKTYFFTFDVDSVVHYYAKGRQFWQERPYTPLVADLASEYDNIMGNLYARLGRSDSAIACFTRAYHRRLYGLQKEYTPDILMNLADVYGRQGRYDLGAYWYRRALFVSDSLGLPHTQKLAIYYGLGQIYMALRDFDLCDQYFDMADRYYDDMQTYERYIYLNNRGNSYYYRNDYKRAMDYFRRCDTLVSRHSSLAFERNLCYLNMGDVFLRMGQIDSSEAYLDRCRTFFGQTGSVQALYYADTQALGQALERHELDKVRSILAKPAPTMQLEPDILLIRMAYLEQYFREEGNYRQAYRLQQRRKHIEDSVRGERVRMLVADAAMRYQQDSTFMAQNVLIQQQQNEVFRLRQVRTVWIALCLMALLVGGFVYMYSKKKRALLLSQNRREVSSLRLENIRNRLSPHFIFNVLNQEMAGQDESERRGMASLVKLMRRNLELAEQLCVTLTEELDFVQTYIDLERRSLGLSFDPCINIGSGVYPNAVMLPSMLIQIPVENAVKHALRGKEGKRFLWIDVKRTETGSISITITDNGGGYRHDSRQKGTGTGMKVIMQTIQILNMKNKEKIEVSVHDVVSPSGEKGCEVWFLLPEKYDYSI